MPIPMRQKGGEEEKGRLKVGLKKNRRVKFTQAARPLKGPSALGAGKMGGEPMPFFPDIIGQKL
jgi:hypothetical protein